MMLRSEMSREYVVRCERRRVPLRSLILLSVAATILASWTAVTAQQPVPGVEEDLAAEMTRLPPIEAVDALETFAIQDGYTLQLVASEPLVSDPVDACFDAHGRMFVAEMHGYPYSEEVRPQQPEPIGKKDAGIIRMLEDADGDGIFETSTVFADKLSWPTSVCCYDDGLFVLAPSVLLYLKDTDGDGKADLREEVMTGFPRANVQGLANNMKWTLDNRIVFAGGTNGGDLVHRGKPVGSLRGRDVAYDPRTDAITLLTGGRQFGMGLDDYGNRFVCTNSSHIEHIVFDIADLAANPAVRVSGAIRGIAAEGAAAPVFRTSPPEPWRIVRTRRRAADPSFANRLPATELVPIGFFTSATGVTIVRGHADPQMKGMAVIGDVGGNLVHRKTLTPDGASFVARRVDENVEFITSTDTWFRPVNFVNAPDGCLYILDMYRETIEHPASIPEDIKAHVDLESGDDRGRIWRITPPGWKFEPPATLAGLSSAELVEHLAAPGGWHRETAQRLLYERQDKSVADQLRKLAAQSDSATGRMHAVATLSGLGLLRGEDLAGLLSDEEPRSQAFALNLWRRAPADTLDGTEQLRQAVQKLAGVDDPRVQVELALSLRLLEDPLRRDLWRQLALRGAIARDLRTALLLSAATDRDELVALLADAGGASGDQQALLLDLVEMIGTDRNPAEAFGLLTSLADASRAGALQQSILVKLAEGLRNRSSSLAALIESTDAPAAVRELVGEAFAQAREIAAAGDLPDAERVSATRLLAHAPLDLAGGVLAELLLPQTSQRLQTAAIEALRQQPAEASGEILLEAWGTLSPTVRKAALSAMLSQTTRTTQLLSAIGEGKVRPGDLESADRQMLLNHPRKPIRDHAEKVLGQPTSADREAVIAQYSPALHQEPDLTNGQAVFKKVCSTCHRIGDEGHVVGPDLTSVANKSPEDLLIALLDPNREAQPSFASYTVLTTDGRVVTGLIAAESAESVTLRQAEAKEETIRREDIEVMNANGVSLMPAGLEKDLNPRQIADVIALVRSLGAKAAKSGE
jgi:putative membrane-bound dehydrogenase-like protein